jgi:hypothetical protein
MAVLEEDKKQQVDLFGNVFFKESAYIYIRQLNNKSYGKKRYDVNKRKSKKRLV